MPDSELQFEGFKVSFDLLGYRFMTKKVIVFGGVAESLINFRGDLLTGMVDEGWSVTTMSAAPLQVDIYNQLQSKQVDHINLNLKRNGLNPFQDMRLLWEIRKVFKNQGKSKLLAYTIKPVIWGGFVSRTLNFIQFYPLITGLGYSFQGGSLHRNVLKKIVVFLYRCAIKKAENVFFQNPDNADLFIKLGIVSKEKVIVVNGSGVNIDHYQVLPAPEKAPQELNFLCVARLLKEKGLYEYASAAKIVKGHYPSAKFRLVGPIDPSPDAISFEEFSSWTAIDYLGEKKDVRPDLSDCHVYVLPSYHEGLPRSTLEAMSLGRPVITTNSVGCRETVIDGWNGFQVDVGSAQQLADKMIWMIENQNKIEEMGKNSRKMVEEKFDVKIVNKQILTAMGIQS